MTGTRRLGASASAAVHAVALLALIVVMRISKEASPASAIPTLLPHHLVWVPHDSSGGGSDGGGKRSPDPPKPIRAVGRDSTSVASNTPSPSVDATIEPPQDIAALPVKPLGDAMQIVPGAIGSSGTSPGPGDSGSGKTTESGDGLGTTPGDGFSDAIGLGGPGVTAPTLIERVAPKYTVEAMRARVQGTALVECVIQVDGTVGAARIMRSLDRQYGLDEEALKAARRWRFKPGLLHGRPVPVIVTIELMFTVR